MALKSKEWFLGKCLVEERGRTRYGHLSSRALDLGLRRSAMTAGHILQSCGAAQKFLEEHRQHIPVINTADPQEGFDLDGAAAMLNEWRALFVDKHGPYGRASFHYNWDSLRTYLTRK